MKQKHVLYKRCTGKCWVKCVPIDLKNQKVFGLMQLFVTQ